MKAIPGSEQHANEVLDKAVTHRGERIGTVVEIRHNIPNGRRYAFVRPDNLEESERRIPLDELTLWQGR